MTHDSSHVCPVEDLEEVVRGPVFAHVVFGHAVVDLRGRRLALGSGMI